MSHNITDLKEDLTRVIHGGSINKVKNPEALFRTAGLTLLSKVDPDDTIRSAQITNAVHDTIYDYTAPSDLKGNKVIDIGPQINRTSRDNFGQRFSRLFDFRKGKETFSIRNNSGTKSLRLSASISPTPKTLHTLNSITDNGTWAVGGDAENLVRDTLNKISGAASLRFDLDGSGTTGHIEIADMTQVDLTDQDEIGQIFVPIYLPDASTITNVILRWGNSSTVYWLATVTSPHDQSSFKDGWNILAFNWNGATETGTVDPTAIDYLRVTVTYDGVADTSFRVDKIAVSNGEIYEIEYYSEFIFRNTSGVWAEKTSNDSDILNLGVDSYGLYLNEVGILVAQQLQSENQASDVKFFKEQLYGDGSKRNRGLYTKYLADHPSQAIRPQNNYYRNIYRRRRTVIRR